MERVQKNTLMVLISGVTSWSSKKLLLLAAAVAILCVGSIITSRVYADTGAGERSDSERLITLYDRGVEQSFITSAATVGGALAEAGVAIDTKDRVEPALDEQLVASEYSVNVYRARPLVIIDGAMRQKIMTASQSAEQIARDAGITLYAEDETVTRQSGNLLAEGVSEQFVITRATVFSFTLYGKVIEARTQAKTVKAMLEEKNITLGSNDRLSRPLDTAITAGMELRVWREGKQTQTVEEEIDFDIEVISDANRPKNFKEITTPGEKGKRNVTYEVIIRDGEEVERKEIASVTITPAKKQVEVRGTKPEFLPYTGGGTKTEWLSASGIPRESWGYVDFMVQRESGWNPNAVNRSSGACGLAQALPCSKVGSDPYNPVVSLSWMHRYVKGRYYDGSPYAAGLCGGISDNWQCAYTFWKAKHWY